MRRAMAARTPPVERAQPEQDFECRTIRRTASFAAEFSISGFWQRFKRATDCRPARPANSTQFNATQVDGGRQGASENLPASGIKVRENLILFLFYLLSH